MKSISVPSYHPLTLYDTPVLVVWRFQYAQTCRSQVPIFSPPERGSGAKEFMNHPSTLISRSVPTPSLTLCHRGFCSQETSQFPPGAEDWTSQKPAQGGSIYRIVKTKAAATTQHMEYGGVVAGGLAANQPWVNADAGQPRPQICEIFIVVKCAQVLQKLHRVSQREFWRCVDRLYFVVIRSQYKGKKNKTRRYVLKYLLTHVPYSLLLVRHVDSRAFPCDWSFQRTHKGKGQRKKG